MRKYKINNLLPVLAGRTTSHKENAKAMPPCYRFGDALTPGEPTYQAFLPRKGRDFCPVKI